MPASAVTNLVVSDSSVLPSERSDSRNEGQGFLQEGEPPAPRPPRAVSGILM